MTAAAAKAHQLHAGVEGARRQAVLDHGQSGAVLHGAAGVQVLGLGDHRDGLGQVSRDVVQA